MKQGKINQIYNQTISKHRKLKEEYNVWIKKIDDKHKEIINLIKEADPTRYRKENLRNSRSLSELLKEKSPRNYYQDYIFSYFETTIACRNDMIINNKPIMIYSYLFTITMFLELVFKNFIVTNNEKFKNSFTKSYWKSHNIKTIIESNKNNLLSLGLNEDCYDLLVSEISILYSFTTIHDIAQAFKYPIDKSFKNGIITDKLMNIDISQIKTMTTNHKKLLFIGLIITFLTFIDNITYLINNTLIPAYKELCEDFENISKELK